MKKITIINKLEQILNESYFMEEGYYIKISEVDSEGIVVLSILENDTGEVIIDLQVEYLENINRLITLFIHELYENYINSCVKNINGWNSFSKRKVRSMRLWNERGEAEKVNQVNIEMIEEYTKIETEKKQVEFYKKFASMFYKVRDYLINKAA